jgi:hypothetical protein
MSEILNNKKARSFMPPINSAAFNLSNNKRLVFDKKEKGNKVIDINRAEIDESNTEMTFGKTLKKINNYLWSSKEIDQQSDKNLQTEAFPKLKVKLFFNHKIKDWQEKRNQWPLATKILSHIPFTSVFNYVRKVEKEILKFNRGFNEPFKEVDLCKEDKEVDLFKEEDESLFNQLLTKLDEDSTFLDEMFTTPKEVKKKLEQLTKLRDSDPFNVRGNKMGLLQEKFMKTIVNGDATFENSLNYFKDLKNELADLSSEIMIIETCAIKAAKLTAKNGCKVDKEDNEKHIKPLKSLQDNIKVNINIFKSAFLNLSEEIELLFPPQRIVLQNVKIIEIMKDADFLIKSCYDTHNKGVTDNKEAKIALYLNEIKTHMKGIEELSLRSQQLKNKKTDELSNSQKESQHTLEKKFKGVNKEELDTWRSKVISAIGDLENNCSLKCNEKGEYLIPFDLNLKNVLIGDTSIKIKLKTFTELEELQGAYLGCFAKIEMVGNRSKQLNSTLFTNMNGGPLRHEKSGNTAGVIAGKHQSLNLANEYIEKIKQEIDNIASRNSSIYNEIGSIPDEEKFIARKIEDIKIKIEEINKNSKLNDIKKNELVIHLENEKSGLNILLLELPKHKKKLTNRAIECDREQLEKLPILIDLVALKDYIKIRKGDTEYTKNAKVNCDDVVTKIDSILKSTKFDIIMGKEDLISKSIRGYRNNIETRNFKDAEILITKIITEKQNLVDLYKEYRDAEKIKLLEKEILDLKNEALNLENEIKGIADLDKGITDLQKETRETSDFKKEIKGIADLDKGITDLENEALNLKKEMKRMET